MNCTQHQCHNRCAVGNGELFQIVSAGAISLPGRTMAPLVSCSKELKLAAKADVGLASPMPSAYKTKVGQLPCKEFQPNVCSKDA